MTELLCEHRRVAISFRVSPEYALILLCSECQSKRRNPSEETYPIYLYQIAASGPKAFIESRAILRNFRRIKASLEDWINTENASLDEKLSAMVETIKKWRNARNTACAEMLKLLQETADYLEKNGELRESSVRDLFKDMGMAEGVEETISQSLYATAGLDSILATYREFTSTNRRLQVENLTSEFTSVIKQFSINSRPEAHPPPPPPDFQDPPAAFIPIFTRNKCIRSDIANGNQQNVDLIDRYLDKNPSKPYTPRTITPFTDSMSVVQTGEYTFFLCGCGPDQLFTVNVDVMTGKYDVITKLNREKGKSGLIFYQDAVYIFGGYTGSDSGLFRALIVSAPFRYAEKVSLPSKTSIEIESMPHPRYNFTASRSKTSIFLPGGYGSQGTIDVYSLTSNSYKTLPINIPERIAISYVIDGELVVLSQMTVVRWGVGEGVEKHRETRDREEALWSNLTGVKYNEYVLFVNYGKLKFLAIEAGPATVEVRKCW